MKDILKAITSGFQDLKVEQTYKDAAIQNIEKWLTEEEFREYVPQIEYLIETKNWDLLLDSFYQIIPFGTGGRRGLVGVGPNRINVWTIQSSAQGHSQYLRDKYGNEVEKMGVVITYDVRKYLEKGVYDDNRENPVKGLDCKTLAIKEAEVYAGNGIKVYMFDDFRPTPELSFMVRYLGAAGGSMLSASHNPPEHNGQKVVEANGGQLIPPDDQTLVDTVVNKVKEMKTLNYDEAVKKGLVVMITAEQHEAYLVAASKTSINPDYRSAKIYFSPFHGTSYKTFPSVLEKMGFKFEIDKESSKPDPTFPTITFNIPNPEVVEAYSNLLQPAENSNADIILVTDPDADRIGVMSYEKNEWKFYSGNEIGILVTAYLLEELTAQKKLRNTNVIAKTLVTTNFIKVLADEFKIESVTDLLVGIKYIGVLMDELEKDGRIKDFLIGIEESHGSAGGENYVRDKDALIPGILLAELASKLKDQGKTLAVYLDELYEKYGYVLNYLTEIRLPGAEGMSSISKIQNHFREKKPKNIGDFEVEEYIDRIEGSPILSNTDRDSRNMLVLKFKNREGIKQIQAVIRPSGTEPKLKFYIEVVLSSGNDLAEQKIIAEECRSDLEKALLKYAYKIIGIDFPDRAFLLFWQLPAQHKMKYFDIEDELASLKDISDVSERRKMFGDLLAFLGSNPEDKVNKAFKDKYGEDLITYLNL